MKRSLIITNLVENLLKLNNPIKLYIYYIALNVVNMVQILIIKKYLLKNQGKLEEVTYNNNILSTKEKLKLKDLLYLLIYKAYYFITNYKLLIYNKVLNILKLILNVYNLINKEVQQVNKH